jgi:hypothetical protein
MSNEDPFASASGFESIIDADHFGKLILFTPLEHVFGVKTKFSTTENPTCDVIDTDAVVLDGTDGIEEFESVRVFQGPVIATLKRAAKFNDANPSGDPKTGKPKMVLGRLDRGDDKTGKLTEALKFTAADKRAWILTPPSEEDKQMARDYLAKRPAVAEPNPFEM